MVRAYHPQAFPKNINVNTNYPPQLFDESQAAGGTGFELIGETTAATLSTFGGSGAGDGQFNNPNQAIFDSITTQQMMISDLTNSNVQFFDKSGAFQGKITLQLPGAAIGIGLHPINGQYYIGAQTASAATRVIQVFNTNKTFNFSFGANDFNSIFDVNVGPSTNVYVLDDRGPTNDIRKYDDAGNFMLKFALPNLGTGPGQSRGFGIDSDDNIYVADRINEVIQVFDSTGGGTDPGTPIAILGGPGSGEGQFDQLQNAKVDLINDRIITTESSNGDRIQIFDLQFNHILTFTDAAWDFPLGVQFFGDDLVFVVDRQNDNVTRVGLTETAVDELLYDATVSAGGTGNIIYIH